MIEYGCGTCWTLPKRLWDFVVGRRREDLDADRMLALALIRSIEVVGEAGARVSREGRA